MAHADARGTGFGGIAARELPVREPRLWAGRLRRRAALLDGAPQQIGATSSWLSSVSHDPPACRLAHARASHLTLSPMPCTLTRAIRHLSIRATPG